MNSTGGKTLQKLAQLLVAPTVEPSQRAARIQTVEKDIILPIRCLLIVSLIYYFFFSNWIDDPHSDRFRALLWIQRGFIGYMGLNAAAAAVLIFYRKMSLNILEWLVFA